VRRRAAPHQTHRPPLPDPSWHRCPAAAGQYASSGRANRLTAVTYPRIISHDSPNGSEPCATEARNDTGNDAGKDDIGVPVSQRIRERIKAAQRRFHANDNIADFIMDGERDELLAEVEARMKGVLQALVIDTESDHNTNDTAKRVAKMYLKEIFKGRYEAQPPVTEFPNVEHLNELMIVGPITVRSACSHHFCPIIGKLWVGIMPNEHSNLIGLSKYARLAEWVMGRPQIQEEAVTQVADLLQNKMQPDGLAVVMEAEHFCMSWRGVRDMDSRMINSVMRGSFLKDANLRREFLALVNDRKKG
jgi:GTP cyclohydrolase I